ncbi:uncharacterized protein SPAPADRAFT_68713 [Spathaspora passalidarum NRRL Y-27907]|uniref:PH domain-containing protein n=1 Tax=Spathaspora passalidarum (strain NRRL Y-27907 / 11-Y1) TaxID=619300 RepID=G3AUY9_SPAPN|nr:uncharacterized protein SPAPADRAFT_68713 [Spathaspora passalidarum NRRL Y-27907]EGW29846.1 hypothetical protein SPAPADRAFT_68713 [Spathaspora passalidarum NRRL Y-27907]
MMTLPPATTSSRTINSKLNEILNKATRSPTGSTSDVNKLDQNTVVQYSNLLRANILGKDKQEKVNSIVVLAKLLGCIDVKSVQDLSQLTSILNHDLFHVLFSIITPNMSLETFKAILKICNAMSSIFTTKESYQIVIDTVVKHLDIINIMVDKLHHDFKIMVNSLRFFNDLLSKSLQYHYDSILVIFERLRSQSFFGSIENLNMNDKSLTFLIEQLKSTYIRTLQWLNTMQYDLTSVHHNTILQETLKQLTGSLNEFGNDATPEEFKIAGFGDNPKQFIIENCSILLSIDIIVFLKDSNVTFKKRFHEHLMMYQHKLTFPIYQFIKLSTNLWIDIYDQDEYPNIVSSCLNYDEFIYYTMLNCLRLWQQTKADSEHVDKIFLLITSSIYTIEDDLGSGAKSIEEILDWYMSQDVRLKQVEQIINTHEIAWNPELQEFDKILAQQSLDFIIDQRVVQLLKGSWVYTESYGESLLKSKPSSSNGGIGIGNNSHAAIANKDSARYYFITLSPNRQVIYFKPYLNKPPVNPTIAEMEQNNQYIKLTEIISLKSQKLGEFIGEEDKLKSSRLISIRGTISYEQITLMGNTKPLISFYTDSNVNMYVWLDGIKMLKGITNPDQFSDETAKQLENLIEVRRTIQLLELNNIEPGVIDEDEDVYNLNELDNVTTGFHFMNIV